jgi:tetratricopeptide (TPR) repeat protein
MSEPQDLEKTAMAFATDAVESETQGEAQKALSLYQRAIESLNQLIERYPTYGFSKIYSDRANLYRERASALQASIVAEAESKETPAPPPEPELAETAVPAEESSVDLVPILLEINRKLDELTASIAQLKDDVVNLKVNINDAATKTKQSQKEVADIRNLVYSIKYDR